MRRFVFALTFFFFTAASSAVAARFATLPPAVEAALIEPLKQASRDAIERLAGEDDNGARLKGWLQYRAMCEDIAEADGKIAALVQALATLEQTPEVVVVPEGEKFKDVWKARAAIAKSELAAAKKVRQQANKAHADARAAGKRDVALQPYKDAVQQARDGVARAEAEIARIKQSKEIAEHRATLLVLQQKADAFQSKNELPAPGTPAAKSLEFLEKAAGKNKGVLDAERKRLLEKLNRMPALKSSAARALIAGHVEKIHQLHAQRAALPDTDVYLVNRVALAAEVADEYEKLVLTMTAVRAGWLDGAHALSGYLYGHAKNQVDEWGGWLIVLGGVGASVATVLCWDEVLKFIQKAPLSVLTGAAAVVGFGYRTYLWLRGELRLRATNSNLRTQKALHAAVGKQLQRATTETIARAICARVVFETGGRD